MKDFFVSYCWDDKEIIRPLAELLKKNGVSVWIDNREMEAGDSIPQEIREALDACHTVLLMWSKRSRIARWSRDERRAALSLGKRIIPCLLDDTPLPKDRKAADILYLDLRDREAGTEKLLETVQKPFKPKPTSSAHKATQQTIGNLPYRDNPNFTGRQEILEKIQTNLRIDGSPAITAIVGLGGIGKTELIVHYTYQHEKDYKLIWWLRSEGTLTLAIDYANIAHALNLPQKDEEDQEVIIQAVKRWLEGNDGWLFIFDNAKELDTIEEYLPEQAAGHILITSRNAGWGGVAKVIDLEEWTRLESIKFLLKRTRCRDETDASAVADALGNLPLALEQAGAYMEATGTTLAEYPQLFQEERKAILERGELSTKYPDVVATTWEMAFREIRSLSETPLAFLSLCAFLAPDAVPMDELRENAQNVPKELAKVFANKVAFNDMRGLLLRYSLVRVENGILTIHRLVQAVIQDRMALEEQKRFVEAAVTLIADVFPHDADDVRSWPQCQIWLSHAQATTLYAECYEVGWQSVSLLFNQMGVYLMSRAAYSDAEPLYQRALDIKEALLGNYHPDVATSLNNLGEVLQAQGKYAEAEPLYRRALDIREAQLGKDHPDVANSLNSLASLLQDQGKYADAEPLYRRALDIREAQLGKDHPDVANSLNNLALLLQDQGKYADAEPFHRRALDIVEKQLGKDHPYVAQTLNNLATLLQAQGKYADAEPLYRRALDIREAQLGKDHPDVANSLNNLAVLLQDQGKYAEAEHFHRRVLDIVEKQLGKDHPHVAISLNNLAESLKAQGKYAEAEPLYHRALEIGIAQLGKNHPDVAFSLNSLAGLLQEQGKYAEAEPLCRRALEIREAQLGKDHPEVATNLNNLALLLNAQGKYVEAEPLYRRALEIREAQLGKDHPDMAVSLNNLAALLQAQGKYAEAEPLYHRALDIYEAHLGKDHPYIANSLNNLATLLQAQGKYAEAEPLYRRTLDICEAQLGRDHPNTATVRDNLKYLLDKLQKSES